MIEFCLMERKLENMTNAELEEYKKTLENEFDYAKTELQNMLDKLDKIENEYNNADKELIKRRAR